MVLIFSADSYSENVNWAHISLFSNYQHELALKLVKSVETTTFSYRQLHSQTPSTFPPFNLI